MLCVLLARFSRMFSCASNIVTYIKRGINYPNLPVVKQLYAPLADKECIVLETGVFVYYSKDFSVGSL